MGKKKTSITYDSDSSNDGEISSIYTSSEDINSIDSWRDAFMIDKPATNSKSNLKKHKLSYNNLDAESHYAYLINILQKPTNKKG